MFYIAPIQGRDEKGCKMDVNGRQHVDGRRRMPTVDQLEKRQVDQLEKGRSTSTSRKRQVEKGRSTSTTRNRQFV